MAIIDKPSDYFNTKLYTGNASTQSITGVGFQPDFVWIKNRTQAVSHLLFDVIRGATNRIYSDLSAAQDSSSNSLTAFNSDGFSLGSAGSSNGSGNGIASWNWKAGGSASSNSNGTITSSVSANQEAGFSIVSYTGTSANATVGHGLGAVPKMIMIKELNPSTTRNWRVYHNAMGNGKVLYLDTTAAQVTDSLAWNGDPTSSIFTLGNSAGVNETGKNFIAYCFADVQGYSKFGSYTGNGNANGTFIYTGFKPAFVMVKRTDATNYWFMFDNKRSTSGSNPTDKELYANDAAAEDTSARFDFLSNGFKNRLTSAGSNASGGTYIYMAFAENPFVASNFNPATAR